MQYRPGRIAVSAALCACLLAGCQPPAVTPSPNPTFKCTPEAGGAEFECSQQQYDDMVAKDKLYAEAEAVYRRFLEEEVRVLRLGGTDAATEVILETTAGAFRTEVLEDLRSAKANGVSVDAGSRVVKRVARMPGVSKGGSRISLSICVDSTAVHFLENGRDAGFGSVTNDDLYFAFDGDRLKVIGADGEEVDGC